MTKLYTQTSLANWDEKRWPNFTLDEISCHHCGEFYIDIPTMDALQKLRNLLGGPVTVECGHRCAKHNQEVGGATRSEHLQLAFDLALAPYARASLLALANDAGFTRFGLMLNGLHVDCHRIDATHAHMWTYGPASRAAWHGLFDPKTVKDWG